MEMKAQKFSTRQKQQNLGGGGDDPVASEAPDNQKPGETQKPEAAEEPGSTGKPEAAEEPGSTGKPEATEEPVDTEKPEATDEPQATQEPQVSQEPEVSPDPENPEEKKERAVYGKTYYVDDQNGDDSNDGESEAKAFKTLDKINQTTFGAGDKLLFKRGGVWTGQLSPKGSGAPGNPIVIASYGEGPRPLIQGNNLIPNDDENPGNRQFNAAVFFYNQEYWEITELEVTNKDPVDWENDHGRKYGVLIMAHDAGTLRHMYCRDLYVHDVVSIPIGQQAGIGRGGIIYAIRGNNIETRWDDIVVENNQVGPNINHYGINFISTWGSSIFTGESGIPGSEAGCRVNSTNLIIRNNYCVDVGNAAICPTAYENALIENNVCDTCNSGPNGNVPIWWENGNHTVAQKNEVFNSGASVGKEDSQAFDADVNAKLNYIQYNYTHDNPSGAFFECALGTQYTTHIRYNISQNDGAGANRYGQGSIVTLGGNSDNAASKMYVYNNSFYLGDYDGQPCKSYVLHTWGEHFNPANPENFQFRNNLVINDGDSLGYGTDGAGDPYITGTFSNNAYGGRNAGNIAPKKDPSDQLYRVETDSLVYGEGGITDPYFGLTAPGSGGTSGLDGSGMGQIKDIQQLASGYRIKSADSDLIDAGILIEDNGGADYFGNPVSSTSQPNIGADNSFVTGGGNSEPEAGALTFEDITVNNGESKALEDFYGHCNFGQGMWNVTNTGQYGKEISANDLSTDQQVCKIAIPEGRIFSRFKARSEHNVTITVVSGTEERNFTLSNVKREYKTEFMNPDEAVYIIISSPYGASDVKLDDIILAVPEGGRKNVALHKKAAANGTSQNDPSNVVDDNDATLWIRDLSRGDDGNYWLQVDLGTGYEISDFEVVFEADTNPGENWQYKIEGANTEDFQDPVMLSDQTGTADTNRKQSLICNEKRPFRYVRVTLTQLGGNDDPWPALAELRVFSDLSPYKNASIGKTSTQSRGSNPDHVNDGDYTTGGGNVDLSSPYEWTVDMGENYKIAKTEIVFPNKDNNAPAGWLPDWSYKIDYSQDNTSWTTLVDYTQDPSANPDKESVTQTKLCDIECRYIKVTITKAPTAQPGAWALIREFTAYSPISIGELTDAEEPGQIVNHNLSYGKAVLSDSGEEAAGNITDNNDNTLWMPGKNDTAQIDYGKSYNFTELVLGYNDSTTPKQYRILASNDNENWVEVVNRLTGSDTGSVQREAVTARGRYLKIEFTQNPAEISEFKAYGTEPDREKRRIMVIVPHQDDEMLMSGGIIRDAVMNGDEVKVVIGTNGDYNGQGSGKNRIAESIAALTNINVKKSDMLFLGYADNGGLIGRYGQETNHSQLYQMYMTGDEDKVIPSRNGHTQTYGMDTGKDDYHFEYTGEHADYTRKNFMGDLMHAIGEFEPTDIYSTSMYDMHADHAYINLFVREAILRLQKQDNSFTPTLWDGIVHSVAGDSDLGGQMRWPENNYDASAAFTKPNLLEEATTFDWNKRVSVTAPYQMRQPAPFKYSLKEQSLRLYTSQYMEKFIAAFSKYDEVFWEKPFTSLSYSASVQASSNEDKAKRVIDGIDSGHIPAMENLDFTAGAAMKRNGFPDAEWVSNGTKGQWVELSWKEPQKVHKIVLYDRPDPDQNITSGKLIFDDGTSMVVDALPANGRAHEIILDEVKVISSLKFEITGVSQGTTKAGLAEIEVYGPKNEAKTNLARLIEKAKAIHNDDNQYTKESFEALLEAIEKALSVFNSSNDESALNAAAKDLQSAIDGLKKFENNNNNNNNNGGGSSSGPSSGSDTKPDKEKTETIIEKIPETDTVIETTIKRDKDGNIIEGKTTVTAGISSQKTDKKKASLTIRIPENQLKQAISKGSTSITIIIPEKELVEQLDKEKVSLKVVIPESIMNHETASIDSVILKKEVLEANKKANKNIQITFVNEKNEKYYSWSFKGDSIKEEDKLKDVNLSLTISPDKEDKDVSKLLDKKNKDNSLVVDFNHKGELPGTANVTLYVGNQKGWASGKTGYLYYYDSSSKKLVEQNNNKYKVNKNGYVTIDIDHCSSYVLLPKVPAGKHVVKLFDQVSVKKKITLKKGKTTKLKVNNGLKADMKKKYTTSDKSVVTVSRNGKITGKKPGTAVITTKVTINGKTKNYKTKVTVK